MNWYKIAQLQEEDYKGMHTAPNKSSGAPLHDLSLIYPDDIYSPMAAKYYSHYGKDNPIGFQTINIIQDAKNKPNKNVKIYRAVPDINFNITQEIKNLSDIIIYFNTYNFFPMNNQIIHELQDKYPIEQFPYDKQQEKVRQDIYNQISQLEKNKQNDFKINQGDWVTINRTYAKEHGESNVSGKYKIISKTVKVSDIYTEGDSLYEWGYDPS